MVLPGIERLISSPEDFGILPGRTRVGLLCHGASSLRDGTPSLHALLKRGIRVERLFAPEHGLWGFAQDMVPIKGDVYERGGIEIVSLYGEGKDSLSPSARSLAGIDILIADIQGVGCRYYTFIWTLSFCMEACGRMGIPIIVADRPNPLGGEKVEGNMQSEGFLSFVGRFPIPVVHGMTPAEIALFLKGRHGLSCELRAAPLTGWKRGMRFDRTGLFWFPPSPNMPFYTSTGVYPGICLFEGTNLSEGRGTTKPFEYSGAPWMDTDEVSRYLGKDGIEGAYLRPVRFSPSFHKYRDEVCQGFHILIVDPEGFHPFRTGLKLIEACLNLFPESFRWRREPYEFETERLAFDLLTGTDTIRRGLERGERVEDMEPEWEGEREEFLRAREGFLLYRD